MKGIKKIEADFKFNLGDRARDKITGFEGIVVSRTQWITNCNTYGLQPEKMKDGIPQDRQHFDEPQIELVNDKVHKESRKTGGPQRPINQTNRN